MKFCKECGQSLSENALFCKECGTLVGSHSSTPTEVQPSAPTHITQGPKKPMSKKTKIMLVSVAVAIILLFGAHKIVESIMSQDRLIEQLETALLEKDNKAVAELLTTNDKKMKIDEKSVEGLMLFYKENPDQVNEVITALKNQSTAINKAKKEKEGNSFLDSLQNGYFGYNFITLEQEGKFLFYDKYELNIESVYLTLHTNYQDTILSVNGVEVGKADTVEFNGTFGPFLPGYHTVKGTLKTDFVDLNQEELIFLDGSESKVDVGVYIEAQEVTVELPSYENSAKLYINGKDVGINLSEQNTFGPVLTDGSMSFFVEVELPWGKVRTEEKAIDNYYVTVSFLHDELKNDIMETIHLYNQEWPQAYTTADTSVVTTATQSLKDLIFTEASNDRNSDYALKVQYVGTNFDLDSFYLSNDGGEWTSVVDAKVIRNSDYFYVGEENIELEENNDSREYHLVFDTNENKWLIQNIYSSWGFNDGNIKEYEVTEVKEFTSLWANKSEGEE